MIISLCSLKGGPGKTTLSLHLAHAIALAGKRVIVIDADPQASATNWAASREEKPPFSVVGMARDNLHRDIADIVEGYDHAVIDTPPRVSALARSTILASDLVLIPVQPSSYDIWAADETVTLVNEATQFKPDLKAAFIINRKISRTAIGADAVAALSEYQIPLLKGAIAQRVAFAESSAGTTVLETAPSSTAAKEIKRLAKETLQLMEAEQW